MTINVDADFEHTFWENSEAIENIITELINNNSVIIKFNTEGPCLKSLGIYNFLEKISKLLDVPHENIEIQTHNQSEFHRTFKIKKFPMAYSLPTVQNEIEFHDKIHTKQFNVVNFKKIACFVGRPSWERLLISSYLYKNHKNDTLQTYHYDINKKHQVTGIDKIIDVTKNIEYGLDAVNFLTKCPMRGPDKIAQYPITVDEFLNINSEYYRLFVEVVSETYTEGNTFFPTEKTFRPIALNTPCIINGPKGFLKNLKKLGFKTFDKWWSEDYDNYDGVTRIEKIFDIIDYICSLSQIELNTMYDDMEYVLEHNRHWLNKITNEDFKRVFKY